MGFYSVSGYFIEKKTPSPITENWPLYYPTSPEFIIISSIFKYSLDTCIGSSVLQVRTTDAGVTITMSRLKKVRIPLTYFMPLMSLNHITAYSISASNM